MLKAGCCSTRLGYVTGGMFVCEGSGCFSLTRLVSSATAAQHDQFCAASVVGIIAATIHNLASKHNEGLRAVEDKKLSPKHDHHNPFTNCSHAPIIATLFWQ